MRAAAAPIAPRIDHTKMVAGSGTTLGAVVRHAAEALRGNVQTGPGAVGTVTSARITKAPHGAIYDAWVPFGNDLVAEPELVHHPGPHVFDNCIRFRTELEQDVPVGR